jgi:hypothetical protein
MQPSPNAAESRFSGAPWARALAALALMNALLLLPLWWRDGAFSAWWIPELGLLPLFLGLGSGREWRWCLAALLTFFVLALAGDALVRDVLDRPLNLALDPLLLRAGFHFLSGSLGLPVAVLLAVSVAALVAVMVGFWWQLLQGAARPPWAGSALPLALISVALIFTSLRAEGPAALRPAIVELASEQARRVEQTLADRSRLTARAALPELRAQAIPTLAGREVIVAFVESYGMTAWRQPEYRHVIDPLASAAAERLDAAGLEMMTTRLRSPIRGGQSWLAHATLLSGQRIDNDLSYRRILSSEQDFLSDDFAATGHATRVIAPAIVRPWPEAKALGFDQRFDAAALGYRGPGSGWVGIPDQFSLHRFSRIREDQAEPGFNLLLLISSHAPWLPGPPVLADWSQLDRAQPWPAWTPPPRDRLVYLRDTERLKNRYPHALAYSLEVLFQWALDHLGSDDILLILGDHQPATLITGSGASPDVPVHLIAADAAQLVDRTMGLGFRTGQVPPDAASTLGLEDLRDWFRSTRAVLPQAYGDAVSPARDRSAERR